MEDTKATQLHIDVVNGDIKSNGMPSAETDTRTMVANGAINGHGASNGIINGTSDHQPAPIDATAAYKDHPLAYELSQLPFLYPRKLKVIVAGAGASALSFAHEVETGNLKNIDLQILEKNAGLGGTWFENRYPGCACDIPAHAYLVSLIQVVVLIARFLMTFLKVYLGSKSKLVAILRFCS